MADLNPMCFFFSGCRQGLRRIITLEWATPSSRKIVAQPLIGVLNADIHFTLQDLYRKLLEAESEGILDDVDMTKVEKLILYP